MVKKPNTYPPHVLEIPIPAEPLENSEKLIVLDPSIIFDGKEKKSLWYRIMHKKFHIGWVFLILGIGIITSVTLLIKIAT
tara:strand:- start:546 stop:785 length:240 start_codon:yes stop_codon:yes gene_type:complete